MTHAELSESVRKIIADCVAATFDDPPPVTDDSDLIDDLRLDSLDVVELTMQVEDVWDLEIPDDAIEQFKTVSDVVRYLSDRLGVAAEVVG